MLDEFSSSVSSPSTPSSNHPETFNVGISIDLKLLEARLSVKPSGKRSETNEVHEIASSSNQFNVLIYGIDYVFKKLDPYRGVPELGSAIETFKTCLMNKHSPEERLDNVRNEVNYDALVSGTSNIYDRLFSIIRTAMITYGISCKTNLPNGAPVWKKAVIIIWPEQYQEICTARDGTIMETQPPPPPPELTELEEEKLESSVVERLMQQFNEDLKLESIRHMESIVDKVVSVIGEKLNLDGNIQQGSEYQNTASKSQAGDMQSVSHHTNRTRFETQDVRIID